ncbi:MAG: DUF1152 domain-containing protein [Vulcanimicrobiota bacterium]
MISFPLPWQAHSSTLVAGCGGGFDVICALPLAFNLRARGGVVHLASYSFSELREVEGAEKISSRLFRLHADCQPPSNGYCPELWLCRWWRQHFGEDLSVWCYRRVGTAPLADIFTELTGRLGLEAIVVVDGGVDGLFVGDEHELGTPETDTASLLAAFAQADLARYCAFCAFGTEGTAYAVRHCDALERMAELIGQGHGLGVSALLPQTQEGQWFSDCLEYVHANLGEQWHSHMAGSILAAMGGRFGEQILSQRCQQAPIWVSPLTLLYWFFDLPGLARQRPYLQEALRAETVGQLHDLIQDYRHNSSIKENRRIPI